MSLVFDKQWAAVADMMGERISEENPPVDIKSPMRLKKDVEVEEKAFAGPNSQTGEQAGNEQNADLANEVSEPGENRAEDKKAEEPPVENEEPTFGLG